MSMMIDIVVAATSRRREPFGRQRDAIGQPAHRIGHARHNRAVARITAANGCCDEITLALCQHGSAMAFEYGPVRREHAVPIAPDVELIHAHQYLSSGFLGRTIER